MLVLLLLPFLAVANVLSVHYTVNWWLKKFKKEKPFPLWGSCLFFWMSPAPIFALITFVASYFMPKE